MISRHKRSETLRPPGVGDAPRRPIIETRVLPPRNLPDQVSVKPQKSILRAAETSRAASHHEPHSNVAPAGVTHRPLPDTYGSSVWLRNQSLLRAARMATLTLAPADGRRQGMRGPDAAAPCLRLAGQRV